MLSGTTMQFSFKTLLGVKSKANSWRVKTQTQANLGLAPETLVELGQPHQPLPTATVPVILTKEMTSTPKQIGTLVVVVLKANHLPNKRHIGKQDPYCVCTVNGEKRKTKAVQRGGQHPTWDEELRFTIFEKPDDESNGDGSTPPPLPPKDNTKPDVTKIQGGHFMNITCFADDPRNPDVIGETEVDLTEALTKGETDDWFTLMHKGKFAGKVYLECTFFSSAPAPEKKLERKEPKPNKQYGGPGSFIAAGEGPTIPNGAPQHFGRSASMQEHSRNGSDSLPSMIRSSNTMAHLDLYQAPYDHRAPSAMAGLTNDFGVLNVGHSPHRSETYPPPNPTYGHHPSGMGFSSISSRSSHGFEPTVTESQSNLHHSRGSLSGYGHAYQPSYENSLPQPSSITAPPAPGRPRYSASGFVSIPTASSGFMPLNSAESNGAVPLPAHTPTPGNFAPQSAPTPAPGFPQQSHFGQHPAYASQTPAPSGFVQQPQMSHYPPPTPQPYAYGQQYHPAAPGSTPIQPGQYMSHQSHYTDPQAHLPQGYHEPHLGYIDHPDNHTPPPAPVSLSPPQPPQSSFHQPPSPHNGNYTSQSSPYANVPPPPPLDGYQPPQNNGIVSPPPPPPSLVIPGQGQSISAPVHRQSLPPTPISYPPQQQPLQGGYAPQPLPVPPPPPPPLPASQSYQHMLPNPPPPPPPLNYHPGPPPQPPAQW
ncbi:hypothetical protein DL96DRAFT_1694459 [Flagelloscypha sp. PMI_526]|nr:hypothetical protein DL96DRAFT_1694459 [Flagelloscypha sp. PMI_526]